LDTSETQPRPSSSGALGIEADAEELSALIGPGDANRRLVESLLGVRVSVRDGALWVQEAGEEADVAVAALEGLLAAIRGGRGVSTADVRYAVTQARRGNLENVGELLKRQIVVTHRGKPLTPKTAGQLRYVEAMAQHDLTFCTGPAGTGKTYLAMAMAVAALRDETVSRIVLTRPIVEAGEALGFLPGDMMDKVDPYLRPLHDALHDIMGLQKFQRHLARGSIEVIPLAYMRGRTLNDAFIVLDEAQNTTPSQMKMALTRLGFGSTMVVTGDVTQTDLPPGQSVGLTHALGILQHIEGIAVCRLTGDDIVRHGLVQRIVSAYDMHASEAGQVNE